MIAQALAGAILAVSSFAPLCAVVPNTGQVITGEFAACRAAAIEVRFQLTELVTSDDQRDIVRDKLKEFALAQTAILAVCEVLP